MNSKYFDNKIPKIISDIYDKEKYLKSQEYKKTQYKFNRISSTYSLLILLLFFYFDGFLILDNYCRSLFDSELIISLSFLELFILEMTYLVFPFQFIILSLLRKNSVLIKQLKKHI